MAFARCHRARFLLMTTEQRGVALALALYPDVGAAWECVDARYSCNIAYPT